MCEMQTVPPDSNHTLSNLEVTESRFGCMALSRHERSAVELA